MRGKLLEELKKNTDVYRTRVIYNDILKRADFIDNVCNNNNIYLLLLGCYPVAVVILHVNKT